MRKYILPLITGLICISQIGLSQIVLTCSDASGDMGSTLEVDLITDNFTDIATLQWSIDWDPAVITYIETTNFNSDLHAIADFNAGNVANNAPGDFTTSWSDPSLSGASLANGSVLYTLRFNVVGDMCDESIVLVTDDPSDIEIANTNFELLTPTINPGTASVNGVDCEGGGTDVTIIGSMETGEIGQNVCVTISADNFADIQSVQGGFGFDETVLMFTGLQNFNPDITGLGNSSFNTTDAANGVIQMVFFNGDPDAIPITVPNGTPLFEMCFDVIGAVGQMSTINFGDYGVEPEVLTENSGVVPVVGVDGKVTVTDGPVMTFTTTIGNVTGDSGTNVCVDVSVENASDILTMQYTIQYDETYLSFTETTGHNFPGIGPGSFNANPPDKINFIWSGSNGMAQDIPDGLIYQVCFDILAPCDDPASDVVIVQDGDLQPGDLQIEITNGSQQVIDPVIMNNGTIGVNPCQSECMATGENPDCAGELSGNITATVTVSGDCDCVWYKDGVEIQRGTAPGSCNLNGVGAGTYTLEVECDGIVDCETSVTLVDPAAITIDGTITNATCGAGGSIAVTLMNDVGNVDYNWDPAQPNQATITNLEPNTYNLTVTDGNGCTMNSSFVVEDSAPTEIVIAEEETVDVLCFGDATGSLEISVTGGCPDYTIVWDTDPVQNGIVASDLSAGTYTVTVTDDQGTTATAQFEVEQPDEPLTFTSIVVQNSTGSDGSINVTVDGGTPDYDYDWTPSQPNTNLITDLAPGLYTVVVTDDNGCTITEEDIEVIMPTPELKVDNLTAGSDFNGFNVACNGDNSESISGVLNGGSLPVTLVVTGADSETLNLENYGSFGFDNLGAGAYMLNFTDSDGAMFDTTITITEPDAIQISATTECENENDEDGSITLSVSGGAGDYTYDWIGGDQSVASDLAAGDYTAIVTDENGCEMMTTNTVDSCPIVNGGCYEATSIITPNGDSFNEFFLIMCVNDFPATLIVYDRYGKQVYEQANYDGTWNGVHTNGTDLIEGAYMWFLDVNFGQGVRETFQGTVTILRSN